MEEIRSAIEKASGYLAENPDAATSTDAAATAVREEGLRFRVEGPKGSVTSDMSESEVVEHLVELVRQHAGAAR